MEDATTLVGNTLGQYRIIEQVGEGGMATVFKAFQPGLNRDVALKVLPPNYAKQAGFTERFMREAQAIGNLHHPNILPVYDSGQDKGYSYIVMRYIANARTLTDEMKSQLDTERIIDLIGQVAAALDHAHQAGIIHRDVKPSNILLDGKWALLSDFGLAKMVEVPSELTGTGVGMGTPAYMSPEQGKGDKVDHRTDIYALGIILYEMLTGQVPHRAETPIATVLKRIREPLPLPSKINPAIPEAVEKVLLKTLAPEPSYRYESAGDMAAALKTAFGPTPVDVSLQTMPAAVPSQPTDAPPQPATRPDPQPQPAAGGRWSLPMILGFGGIGLLLCLILAGVGVLVFRQTGTEPASPVAASGRVDLAETAAPVQEEPAPTVAATDTPAPEPTATPKSLSASDALSQADTPTVEPTPTEEPAPTEEPEPTAVPDPPTPAAAAGPFTGTEIFEMALAEAQKWQADAVLSEMSGLSPLDEEGRSDGWVLKFWSPSTKGFNQVMYMNGGMTTSPSDLPVPNAPVADSVIVDTKRLYDIAESAGASTVTEQGYRPLPGLVPYPLDESRLTWYLNYQGGDYRVVYTVIIDAVTGEVIQVLNLQ